MKILGGKLVAEDIKVGIVAARFNEFITSRLLEGAVDGLLRHGVEDEDIAVAWVPGAFEIPLVLPGWQRAGTMMQLYALGRLSGEAPAITTMYAVKCPRGRPRRD